MNILANLAKSVKRFFTGPASRPPAHIVTRTRPRQYYRPAWHLSIDFICSFNLQKGYLAIG